MPEALDVIRRLVVRPVDIGRYETMLQTLAGLRHLIEERRVLDFGCGDGLSVVALLETGAARVSGIEPDKKRLDRGLPVLTGAGYLRRADLIHVSDTRSLPFADGSFDAVVANGVFEHIPQPRAPYVRECWRVLRPGGHLIVIETPNKYLPYDAHTTKLWFVPWLPSKVARRYSVWRNRFRRDGDWARSGWRGCGYYELARAIPGRSQYVQESTRPRHRILAAFGLPGNLLDPGPHWVWRKQ